MSHPVYHVPAGDVLPVFFSTYAAAGESATLTGLAVTDIEIYKDASMTQRASDAGYTLIDTDGIDVDGTTGIHGFTIDTGDNTDASFYTVGAWFTVVVSAITVDSKTVNFIAAQFRLMASETVAGVPEVDVTHNAGTAITSAAGVQEVKVASMASGSITAAAAATDFGTEVADAIWDEVVEHTFTGRQLMRLFAATLAGQASGLGTTTAVYKGLDDSTTRISATVDADGNRTSVSRTVS